MFRTKLVSATDQVETALSANWRVKDSKWFLLQKLWSVSGLWPHVEMSHSEAKRSDVMTVVLFMLSWKEQNTKQKNRFQSHDGKKIQMRATLPPVWMWPYLLFYVRCKQNKQKTEQTETLSMFTLYICCLFTSAACCLLFLRLCCE